MGYIIVWKNPDVRLKDGTISSGKKILIDGQQRITALQAAIVGEPVIGSNYRKKRIKIAFHPLEQRFEVANPAIEKDGAWIPDIAPLYQPGFDSFNFVIDYCIKNQLDIAQVTEIFIRINSKGVVLSQADFAMSKISSDDRYGGNHIRKTMDYFCHLMQKPEDFEAIRQSDTEFVASEDFSKIKWIINEHEDIYVPDYTDVLRVAFTFKFLRGRIADLVSLLSGRDFNSRDYQESIAEESFAKLKEGVLEFASKTNLQRYLMIVKSTGIISPSMIRSQNALNFGYALYLLLRSNGEDAAIIEKVVRRWLVLTILTGRYSGSPESTFDYDIKRFQANDPMEFLENTEAGELSDAFWNNILVTKLDTSVASSPMFHVFLVAQVKMGDFGFLSEQIDVKSLIEQRGDIHHIFPKKYLQKCGIKERSLYNQIANYVYTQSEINVKIKDQAPKEYIAQVKEHCTGGNAVYGGINSLAKLEANMNANCIPQEIFDMDYTQFENFLEKRRHLMAQKIRNYYELLK